MFNIGPGELVVILILALVLLGPDKLPEVARSIGKGMKELRRATEDIRNTVEQEIYRADLDKPLSPPASPQPPPAVAQRLPPASSEAMPYSSAEFAPHSAVAALPAPSDAAKPEDEAGVHPAGTPPSAKG